MQCIALTPSLLLRAPYTDSVLLRFAGPPWQYTSQPLTIATPSKEDQIADVHRLDEAHSKYYLCICVSVCRTCYLCVQAAGHAVRALSFSPDGSLLAVAAGQCFTCHVA